MNNTIADTLNTSSGIPDAGTRIVFLVIITFILGVLMLLWFMKMKEADELTDKNDRGA